MPNHLAGETSPYLLQHAHNPVDWHPWCEEALALARQENKPILLSVGYSACHWCHVMAHESFEDARIAELMNRHFVNIKVDREERPDLDQIYQTAHQMLTQRPGGWPLTMFLTPEGAPFFGGTYFPNQARHGLPGFGQLLERIAEIYFARQGEIERQNAALLEALNESGPDAPAQTGEPPSAPLGKALDAMAARFDSHHGGFGGAPKFPHPPDLDFLLRRHAAGAGARTAHMALTTLRRMAQGGIYDQIGGGFCRYSVDERWEIPHFEKMLYDNGPLLRLYADAWLISGDALFLRVAEETAGWVIREMQSPEGGYYSSLDADSEHEEGKFYVWSREEIQGLLTSEEHAIAAPHFGLDQPANFEGTHWHLRVAQTLETVAQKIGVSLDEGERRLAGARRKLFAARAGRVRPGRDEKILASWNALMIEGMAHAARALGRDDWLDSARRALKFIHAALWHDEGGTGRLRATCKDGRAHLNAYLDDYAFLLSAMLELLQAEFHSEDLTFARQLADVLLDRFDDRAAGGFFFTSHDHERLIHRPKWGHDGATASGNGVAALALLRLGHLLGDGRYLEAAERALRLFYPQIEHHPSGYATLMTALDERLDPPASVILRGPQDQVRDWQRGLQSLYLPRSLTLAIPQGTQGLPQLLQKPCSESVNAWVCRGVNCYEPIADFPSLVRVCRGAELI